VVGQDREILNLLGHLSKTVVREIRLVFSVHCAHTCIYSPLPSLSTLSADPCRSLASLLSHSSSDSSSRSSLLLLLLFDSSSLSSSAASRPTSQPLCHIASSARATQLLSPPLHSSHLSSISTSSLLCSPSHLPSFWVTNLLSVFLY
jgi:hypothetical protein